MAEFKALNFKPLKKAKFVAEPDSEYWKLETPVLVKEFGPIDHIDFSPVEPYYFAVTCSVRVQVYNPITKLVVKNLSRFRENAYGATFRSDGRLLCAGGEESVVKLFDVALKSQLRLFKGHTAPVHRTYFVTNSASVASFSDDKSVKVWDIATETAMQTYAEHSDYVRAGAVSPVSSDVVLSGGYDGFVKMYDSRSGQAIMSVEHGSPVEALLYLPSGGVFVSAGGTEIKIWDALAGGRQLGSVSQHHKTVTCLRLAQQGRQLLSGSLDRHVKVYDTGTFRVVHTFDYPNAVLSLGVSRNDDTIVAGLVDGLVSVARRDDRKKDEATKPERPYQYTPSSHHRVPDQIVVPETKRKELPHDRCLRKYEYKKAAELALKSNVVTFNPEITVSVLAELHRRQSVRRVLEDLDEGTANALLRFFIRYMSDARFTKTLLVVADVLVDVLERDVDGMSGKRQKLVRKFLTVVQNETELLEAYAELDGQMKMLLAAAETVDVDEDDDDALRNMRPSLAAQKNVVVNIT